MKDTIQLLYTVWYLLNSVRKIEIYQDQQMCRRTRRFGGIDGVNQEIRDEADARDRLEIQDRDRGENGSPRSKTNKKEQLQLELIGDIRKYFPFGFFGCVLSPPASLSSPPSNRLHGRLVGVGVTRDIRRQEERWDSHDTGDKDPYTQWAHGEYIVGTDNT